jgi:CDP-diacylglycerol--serine O-phosphatidyltransferase
VNIRKHIPNAITCGNLFCGCLAIVVAFQGNLIWTAYLVGLAAVLDFLDGFAARLLHVSGELGKQLDSLADMVTFGVVPGVVLYQLFSMWVLRQQLVHFDLMSTLRGELNTAPTWHFLLPFMGFLITIFSCIRLAKFNIDFRQSDSFIGLPTPANAALICSLPLILNQYGSSLIPSSPPAGSFLKSILTGLSEVSNGVNETIASKIIINPWFLGGLTLFMSFLMIAELPLFALKFKNFTWTDNKMRYSFLLLATGLLIIFQYAGIPIIILLYVVLSIINNVLNKFRNEVQG